MTKIIKYTGVGTWETPDLGEQVNSISFSSKVDFTIRNLDDTNEKIIHAGDVINVIVNSSSNFPFEVNITGDLEIITDCNFTPEKLGQFEANETNIVSEYLTNGGNANQIVDGSVTPVTFSSTPVPAGKKFIVARVMIYMEGATAFDSTKFGDLVALTNGWKLAINGVESFLAKDNKELVSQMFDAHGSEIFGKLNRTMIARFSFNKFTDGADGITIKEGETIDTIVNDDLTGLTFLNVRVQGILKDA